MSIPSGTDSGHGMPGRDRYVVLTFAGLHLVLRHTEVYTLEPRSDVQPGEDGQGIAGWIVADGQTWPVVCFDAGLSVTTVVPVERRVCVLLHHKDGYAGILCEAVTTLEAEAEKVFSLPPALGTSASPVHGLLLQDGFLGCLTSSVELLALIPVSAGSDPLPSRGPSFSAEAYS